MQLVDNWKDILKKAWSLKFNALAIIAGGAESYIALVQPAGVPNGMFATIGVIVSTMAFGARLLAQKEISGGQLPKS